MSTMLAHSKMRLPPTRGAFWTKRWLGVPVLFWALAITAFAIVALPAVFEQVESSSGKPARGTKRVAPPGSPAALFQERLTGLRQEAAAAFRTGNYGLAEAKQRAILALSSEDAPAWHGLGRALERQGRVAQALDAYKLLVHPQPRWGSSLQWDASFLAHYAELCEQDGRELEAMYAWARVLERGRARIGPWAPSVPRQASTLSQARARALSMAGISKIFWDKPKAQQLLNRSLALEPDLPETHFYVGYLLDSQKKYAQAKAEFDLAEQLSNHSPEIVEGVKRMIRRTYWEYGVQPSYGGSLSLPNR